MKTIEEFINEVENSEALQGELKAVKNGNELTEFLKKNDVDGTVNDLVKALKARQEAEGEISDDEADAVAGGAGFYWYCNTRLL